MAGPWEDFQTAPAASRVVTDRKTGSVERVEAGPWEDFSAPKVRAEAPGPWQDFEPQQATWFGKGGVVSTLPEQIGASFESVRAHLKLMKSREALQQRPEEGTVAPGFNTTPGGAASGLVRPSAIIRQEQLRGQDQIAADAAQIEAEEASSLQKFVTPKNMSFGQEVISSAAQSAPPVLTALGVGIITRNPALPQSSTL